MRNVFRPAPASLFADISTGMLYPGDSDVSDADLAGDREHRRTSGRGSASDAEHRPGLFRRAVGQAAKAQGHRAGRVAPGSSCQATGRLSTMWQGVLGARHVRARALRRATLSSHRPWTSKTEAEPSGLRVSATMWAESATRCPHPLRPARRHARRFLSGDDTGLLAFLMVFLVTERPAASPVRSA